MYSPELPTVTVLINTYNYAHFLARAIESALQQEYDGPRLEVLVVDDGSIDDTAEVVRRYSDRVRYVTKPNGGQASAFNLGFREATGEIICLLDSDDYFYPGKVQLVASALGSGPDVGFVYNEFDIVDPAGKSLGKSFPEPTFTGRRIPLSSVAAQLPALIRLGHPWTAITSAMSVRRSVVAGLEVPEDLFPHSADLFLGLVLPFLTEVAILETPLTAYVFHGENVELFRSSAANRTIYQRQLAYIRDYVEAHYGVRFLGYGGRSIYDSAVNTQSLSGRYTDFIRDARQIAEADVGAAIKRHCRAKLTASLLPGGAYELLRALTGPYRARHRWKLRRGIAAMHRTRGTMARTTKETF
jgi:glycosyltransferase involved in cell wall biosynthesis